MCFTQWVMTGDNWMGYDSPLGGSSTVIKDVIALLPRELIFAVFSSCDITIKQKHVR